jgi:hypothetical protein
VEDHLEQEINNKNDSDKEEKNNAKPFPAGARIGHMHLKV